MIDCVLLDQDHEDEEILTFSTTQVPPPGTVLYIKQWQHYVTTAYTVVDALPDWRIHAHSPASQRRSTPVVFVRVKEKADDQPTA